ncbi:hypothetical protein DFH94DRAFT_691588 [Russula ochroleuca]|uniref:Uncharacterized protein n=1 Tax=Russula ochroleuca TaxID=152965 RepID=A0A9P5MYW2_9AGAM|nr:hypothetical protein DFH94DRAFT_691588 [Russula ochroleuca]
MADFAQGLDASKLILAETLLSFIISPFTAPPYNFPLFLFGLYVQESQDAAPRLLQFSGYLSASAFFDIIWLTQNHQTVVIRLCSILILLLKFPTVVAFVGTLSSRGVPNINLSGADFGGATVWAMPGGFTSGERDGYQTVEPETQRPSPNHPPANPPPAPGAYQSV